MTSEADLKRACLQALARIGVFAMGNALAGRTRKAGLGPGSPDIVVVLPPIGVLVAIELKKESKQRPTQKTWQADFERCGGIYVQCRTVKEVCEAVFSARKRIQSVTRLVPVAESPRVNVEVPCGIRGGGDF
jgi:hypothetical protein